MSDRTSNLRIIEPYRSKDGVTAEVTKYFLGGAGCVVIQADTATGDEAEVTLSAKEAHDIMLWLQCALKIIPDDKLEEQYPHLHSTPAQKSACPMCNASSKHDDLSWALERVKLFDPSKGLMPYQEGMIAMAAEIERLRNALAQSVETVSSEVETGIRFRHSHIEQSDDKQAGKPRSSPLPGPSVISKTKTPTLREALTELLARCEEVKRALDANIPDDEPVHPQSAALTWPMSSAALALENSPSETTDRRGGRYGPYFAILNHGGSLHCNEAGDPHVFAQMGPHDNHTKHNRMGVQVMIEEIPSQEPSELPDALRDPIKCMERGRELLTSWGPTPVTDAMLAESKESPLARAIRNARGDTGPPTEPVRFAEKASCCDGSGKIPYTDEQGRERVKRCNICQPKPLAEGAIDPDDKGHKP
jgi:hypothetical protein